MNHRRFDLARFLEVSRWVAISVFDDYNAIVDACCAAWNRFEEQPEIVSSITSRQWAQVSP